MKSIAVLVLIETNDERLIDPDVTNVDAESMLRQAVVENLLNPTRVIGVMLKEDAELWLLAHHAAAAELGEHALSPFISRRSVPFHFGPERDNV